MTSILQYLVLFYGSSLYKEKEQLSNLLADLYLGEDRLKRLYRRAIMDDDLSRKVYELSLKQIYEREVYLKQIIATFIEKNFIAPYLGRRIVDSFVAGLGLEIKSFISTKVFEEDGVWEDEFRVKYSLDKRKLLEAPNSIKGLYKIREETVAVCDGAFRECLSLSSVLFPYNLISIGDSAFEHSGIAKLELPPNLLQIGKDAFYRCLKLANISFNANLKRIGDYAFACCGISSVTIPFFIESLSDGLFRYCDELSSVDFHDNLKIIGKSVFEGCKNLTNVDLPQSLTCIGKDAFLGCEKIHYINIPSDLTIEAGAFAACSNLSMINLLSNAKYVFKDGLLYTSDMKEVLFCMPTMTVVQLPPTIERIADKAFYGCKELSEIKLPKSLLYIGDSAFYNCQSLHKIKLPVYLKRIGKYSFAGTNISSIYLPASLENVGYGFCSEDIKYINIPEGCRDRFVRLLDKEYYHLLVEGLPWKRIVLLWLYEIYALFKKFLWLLANIIYILLILTAVGFVCWVIFMFFANIDNIL